MYLFYNRFATLHVSNDYFIHHQEFIKVHLVGLFIQFVTTHGTYNDLYHIYKTKNVPVLLIII